MAVAVASPFQSRLLGTDTETMNTIPDPRTPSPHSLSRSGSSTSFHHPDLSSEVATLSTKLINAINHQTNLDDRLQATRHELEAAREQIARLDAAAREHRRLLEQGLLVPYEDVEKLESRLRSDLSNEKAQRGQIEKEKKGIEVELENLTTALFQEANTMVAAARKDREVTERKNEQLRTQLNDMELLLASQQEQLQDLKAVMQQMGSDRDGNESIAHMSTSPSTPANAPADLVTRMMDGMTLTPHGQPGEEVTPDQPLRFSNLIRPVMRFDLQAYDDFVQLLKSSQTPAPSSRVQSGSYGGLNVMGLAGLRSISQSNLPTNTTQPSNGSNTSLPTSSPTTPNMSAAPNSSPRESLSMAAGPLKDSRFFKRAVFEDVEPTLRLEAAPGLSWLARRSVLSSICSGTLIVEPIPQYIGQSKSSNYSCGLCGENRKGELYARWYRFRTSDSEDAQRYPLCDYCLTRVRATCDFVSFLRMARDGHLKAETEEEQKSAWEESVRLRERMFWARLGGGVVPAILHAEKSPAYVGRRSFEHRRKPSEVAIDGVEDEMKRTQREDDPFAPRSSQDSKRVTIGNMVISKKQRANHDEETWGKSKDEVQADPRSNLREDLAANPVDTGDGARLVDGHVPEYQRRLSIQIPGGFD